MVGKITADDTDLERHCAGQPRRRLSLGNGSSIVPRMKDAIAGLLYGVTAVTLVAVFVLEFRGRGEKHPEKIRTRRLKQTALVVVCIFTFLIASNILGVNLGPNDSTGIVTTHT